MPSVKCADAYLLFVKNGLVQKLVYEIKYNGNQGLAHELGGAFACQLKEGFSFSDYDFIIPVPLHKKKLRSRGFNQSEELAKGILSEVRISMRTDVVKRVVNTKTQTSKGKLSRLFSLQKAFEIDEAKLPDVRGSNVILLDDVVTTGATISEIVDLLESAGVNSVAVLSLSAAM